MDGPVAKSSPQILAIQKERPPSITASTKSGRDLVKAHEEISTIFVPETVYTFCTSPEHTVTACLANSTVDSPVRMIAEHLFGLGYGSFQLFTGEQSAASSVRSPSKEPVVVKGVKGWIQRLSLRPRKAAAGARAAAKAASEAEAKAERERQAAADAESSRTVSDDSDCDPATDDHWRGIRALSNAELAEVRRCGQWRGAEPSDLFLNIYGQALLTLGKNVLNGLVSPPLMGASGVAPLTIISHTSDIVQHYSDLILTAEREIFFTTNVWEASTSSKQLVEGIRELSKRVVTQGGEAVVMKIMYDRDTQQPQQGGAHQIVRPEVYTSKEIGLPAPDEIPGVLLEVQNYHVHPVGSFHQKSVIIDRKIALLSSNNVQKKGDVGFMVQLEGPIVQSFYDTALLSWWTTLNPRPPLLYQTPSYPDKLDRAEFQFGDDHPIIHAKGDLQVMAERTVQRLAASLDAPIGRITPSSQPAGSPTNSILTVGSPAVSIGEAWSVTSQSTVASTASPATLAPSVVNGAVKLVKIVSHENPSPTAASVEKTQAVPAPAPTIAETASTPTDFAPITVHKPHDPFPIALVNRTPRGQRGEGDAFVPQNQAWMAGFKLATESIFVQTPTFSAKPVVAAALDAVRRGVLVEIYADLGFNEQGELSADGLANQAVAAYMYKHLQEEQRDKLRICWYVAKGESSPRTNHTCHIKMMIIDGKIGIQGNGRQDMSSWYHAQEINILLDSAEVCADWRRTLETNQNTGSYGRVGHDGVWRDNEGQSLPIPEPTPTLSLGVAMRRLNTATSIATSADTSGARTSVTIAAA